MKKYSFKNIFFNPAGQFLLIGLLSLTVACKDEPARLTGDVLPEGEKIEGLNYDAYVLNTANVSRTDAGGNVRTSDATYGIIGTFNDPVFGQTKADFVTNFSIGSEVKFSVDYIDAGGQKKDAVFRKFNNNHANYPNDTWKVDSLVLNLQYQFNNWYGDMLSEQTIKAYRLRKELSVSEHYFNNEDLTGMYDLTVLGDSLVHPNSDVPDTLRNKVNWSNLWAHPDSLLNAPEYLWDNIKVKEDIAKGWLDEKYNDNKNKTKYWSINLDKDLTGIANEFFNLEEATLKSSAAFQKIFNGLYVTADIGSGTEGSLTKINLLSASSVATNITIHLSRDHKFMNDDNVVEDKTTLYSYTFPINVENARFNRYEHTLSPDVVLDNPATDRLYIQGMAGSYARMQLPEEIINWVDSVGDPAQAEPFSTKEYHMVSNVEFFMEIDTTHYPVSIGMDRYPIPNQLSIKWMNEKGEIVDPVYSTVVNGNKISSPVFGSDADSKGQRSGIGERVIRYSDEGNAEYLYRFILRADYFNYIMRNEDGGGLNEKKFFIGPTTPTSNFQRVVLYSGANMERPMKMNIKYFKYRTR